MLFDIHQEYFESLDPTLASIAVNQLMKANFYTPLETVMEKVNNINGIIMYYEIDKEQNRFIIYDSGMNYFNDLWCQALLMTVRRSCVVGHGLEKKTTSRSLRPLW